MRKTSQILVILGSVFLGVLLIFVFSPKFKINAVVPSLQWESNGELLYEGGWATNILRDEDGFYYLAIFDSVDNTAKIRKMSDEGENLWAQDVTIASPGAISKLISDGNGGVIVVYLYDFDGVSDLYAQKLNANGEKLWGTNGAVVCSASGNQSFVDAISDEIGGIIVTWRDGRNSAVNNDIYSQKINSSGTVEWVANGVLVGGLIGSYKSSPHLVSDGSNGAIITWSQNETGSRLLRAQRINSAGSLVWASSGVLVSGIISYDAYPVSDGVGGVLIAGTDSENQIFIQHINEDGSLLWTDDGKIIASVPGAWFDISVVSTGAGNGNGGNFIAMADGTYILAWSDYRNGDGSYTDLYAQKIDSDGNILWADNGIEICTEAQDQSNMVIVPDGSSGIISIWADFRDDPDDSIGKLYAQRVSSEGELLWGSDGMKISDNELDLTTYFSPVGNDHGGVIITWRQFSETSEFVTYGKKLLSLNQIKVTQENLDVLDEYGNSIKENSLSGANGSSITVLVKDMNTNLLISDVVVDLTTDRDWSIVSGSSNGTEKKSYIANMEEAPGATNVHTLYIPKGVNDTNVIICPNVTNLDAVDINCSGAITKSALDQDTSIVTVEDLSYWKVVGLTGTGGISVILGASDSGDTSVDEGNNYEQTGYSPNSTTSTTEDFIGTDLGQENSKQETEETSNAKEVTNEVSQESSIPYILYIISGLILIGGIVFFVKKKRK